ncbi:unnamed protein product [Callosobruchus maculatus]|uniref:Uncharacterized protein n=1 Tax=Callosobruchus maculatus TaxID=64391 RepID=A0A653D911_CALMS|nr:unnamed protein product [Callosobruchus maculatus]
MLLEQECKVNFRFEKRHIPRLVQALRIPDELNTDSQHKVSGQEALCILLRRLSYPNRLADLEPFF